MAVILSAGCSREFVGAAYEYQNKKALDDLENDFEAGRIDKDEYLRRKQEIEEKSVIY